MISLKDALRILGIFEKESTQKITLLQKLHFLLKPPIFIHNFK